MDERQHVVVLYLPSSAPTPGIRSYSCKPLQELMIRHDFKGKWKKSSFAGRRSPN